MDNPPIAKLHRDLLWQIFATNAALDLPKIDQEFDAYSPSPSPLTTARHTSQVCTSWRQLIIDSPSLWGNIIHLGALRQKSDAWRNKVLLRTGNSDLSIFGILYGAYIQHAKEFLEMLLKNHWTRIKWVHITIDSCGTVKQWPDSAWRALGRPAPNLRFFSIRFEQKVQPSICSSPGFILFANHAPLLVHFEQNHLPINLEASWISDLISLTLNSASNLKLSILLETCSRMRSLQTLRLIFKDFANEGPSPEGSLHYVNIPSLSTLVIEWPFDVSLAFLDHIEPAPGCSLQLSANLKNIHSITPTELVAAQRILAKFANNYFCHRSATSFQLSFIPRIKVSAGDIGGFKISIRGITTEVSTSLFLVLLGTFEPPHISGVKVLHLVAYARSPPPLSTEFLAAMTALEELQITPYGLIYFISLLDGIDQQRSFPHLKILKWVSVKGCHNITSLIVNFLATRRKIGMPIEIFDFTDWYMVSDVPMDTKMLEEIPGLKVVWREEGDRLREYICGSGRSQELDAISNST